MKNIFITAAYNKRPEYGILIPIDTISVNVYNTLKDKQRHDFGYCDEFTNQINLNIDTPFDYIYLLESYISDKVYGDFVDERNINISLHDFEFSAILAGKETMLNGIATDIETLYGEDADEDDLDLINNQNFYNFTFKIYKIKTNRHIFESEEDQLKYYNENLKFHRASKKELYDFLLDVMGGYQINSYNMNGELYHSEVLTNYRTIDNLGLKSLLGYHVEKFNVGDIVRIKHDPHNQKYYDIFMIKYKYTKDRSIYESDDPLHYREGYTLVRKNDLTLSPINDYFDEFFYDEDLELVTDEELLENYYPNNKIEN